MDMAVTEDNDNMKNVTFRAPVDLVEEFDDSVWKAQVDGRLDREDNRSSALRKLMKKFIEDGEI